MNISREEFILFLKSDNVREENYGLAADDFFAIYGDPDENAVNLEFADKVKALLKEKNLTQNEFAEMIGKSPQNLSKMINNGSPTRKTIMLFAKALNVNFRDLS
ncbi:helix-turn-helix domain-containing protein [Pedobacter sp.]|uniref:helix-turn-helix domain-containing protein n=1 Tax=Pedobacter sp. TaxID=1411316 RepID=UPI003C3215C6